MKQVLAKIKTGYYTGLEFFELLFNFILTIPSIFTSKEIQKENYQILIVPGFLGSHLFYKKIQKKLEKEGFQTEIAPFSFSFRTKTKVSELSDVLLKSQGKLTVIAHNTGGLITMVLPDESRQKIDTFITLGTPFYGSFLFQLTSIFGLFANWKYKADYLQNILNNALLFNYFFPFSPISDSTFLPKKSSEFGQGRDWWFDIPGNFNLVRRKENLRTLAEFLKSTPSLKSILEKQTPDIRLEVPKRKKITKQKTKRKTEKIKKKINITKQKKQIKKQKLAKAQKKVRK